MTDGDTELDSQSTDALVRRVREGSQPALDRLFARLRRSVRRWSSRLFSRGAGRGREAGDVVELVVSRALPRLQGFEPRHRDALRHYLRTAVWDRARDDLRFCDGLRAHEAGGEGAGVEEIPEDERDERLRHALTALTSRELELLVARFELQLSFEQIALATQLTGPTAARAAVTWAIVRLGQAMERG